MRAVCIVQARLGSSRLPGKVLLPLGHHTVLWHVLTRCKRIKGIDEVICAVPDEERSSQLEAEAAKLDVRSFRGSELDVLKRYYDCAIAADADIIMRITADCPLIEPKVCWWILTLLYKKGVDYASNVMPRTYPKGLDCEVFRMAALKRAHDYAVEPYDREHVTPFIQANMSYASLPGPGDYTRLVLDTYEDYQKLSRIMSGKMGAQRKIAA